MGSFGETLSRGEAIRLLNAIPAGDNEAAHGQADYILLAVLRGNNLEEVAKAWEKACERCKFWYA